MELDGTSLPVDAAGESNDMSTSNVKLDTVPFKLSRKNFMLNYRLHYAMKSVFIHPFQQRTFSCSEFLKWVAQAREFSIKRTWKGDSACMLTFDTYTEADNAIADLRLALGDDVVIRHTKNSLYNPEQDLDSVLDYAMRDSLATRILLLESIPPDVTQEQIAEFFPDARAVMRVKHDPSVTGLALIEYQSTKKAHQVLEEHMFSEDGRSYIVIDGQQVTISKYNSRLNQAERAMRKTGPPEDKRKSFEQKTLSDDERMETCTQLKSLIDERDACLEDTLSEPTSRVLRYVSLSEEMSIVAAGLNWDANRREKEYIRLPEPSNMKTWQQLYKEDQSFGGDAYVKPITNGEPKQVRSLLDLNPFEVPSTGSKRPQPLPLDAGPPKKLLETNFPTDGSSQSNVSDCMQSLRKLSSSITTQVNRMDELLNISNSGDAGAYRGMSHGTTTTPFTSQPYRNDSSAR